MAALSSMLIAATALQAVGSIYGGIQANKAAKEQARIAQEDARAAADARGKQITKLKAEQQAQFAASGVTLDGTPLMVLDETQREGDAEVNDILRQGRNNAKVIRTQGRNALTSGILSAATTTAGNTFAGYQTGVYGAKK